MKKWLVTLLNESDLAAINFDKYGSSVCSSPMPMGDEIVVSVEGPADLPLKLKNEPLVIAVYPNSNMELSYGNS
jgi:hypothetical protein